MGRRTKRRCGPVRRWVSDSVRVSYFGFQVSCTATLTVRSHWRGKAVLAGALRPAAPARTLVPRDHKERA